MTTISCGRRSTKRSLFSTNIKRPKAPMAPRKVALRSSKRTEKARKPKYRRYDGHCLPAHRISDKGRQSRLSVLFYRLAYCSPSLDLVSKSTNTAPLLSAFGISLTAGLDMCFVTAFYRHATSTINIQFSPPIGTGSCIIDFPLAAT